MLFLSVKDHHKNRSVIKTVQASWYKNWELYPILFFTTFLRFYRINTSEFDFDQASIYRLAYDAVHHGLWPVTNNTASLGFANAPGELYLVMIPAAFSANPMYGTYIVSLLASIAILITYIFTTRYYGRLAGTIASLLSATAAIPLYYSRFLWQPNIMYPFVILFMFMLFIGVVERRKGWFGPALILLGILYQTHGTTLLLAVPLLLACCMAFRTLRWRDLLYGIAGLAVILFPFILWQITSHVSDLQIIFAQSTHPFVLNTDAWQLYRLMISPYDVSNHPGNPYSFTRALIPLTSFLYNGMCFLVIAGGVLALVVAIAQWRQHIINKAAIMDQATHSRRWHTIWALPSEACGLLLLCVWQITPILAMLKHASALHPQYMLVVLPGPFILISYIMVALGKRVQLTPTVFWIWLRAAAGILLTIVIVLELVNSVATLRDQARGYFTSSSRFYDLYSQQKVINDAKQLAKQRHLKRIFIGVDIPREETLLYLSEHMHYPTSIFFFNQCMLLPSAADGPAILIMPPYIPLADRMVETHGAHLLEQAPYLNNGPFNIYELPSAQQSQPAPTKQNTFVHNLQSLGAGYQDRAQRRLFTRWSLLRAYPLATNTTYSYHFTIQSKQKMESTCTFSMAHAGDQLLPAFAVPAKQAKLTTLSVSVQAYTTTPDWPMLGPLHLETHRLIDSKPVMLRTSVGKDAITIGVRS
jgi:hypothetical protein